MTLDQAKIEELYTRLEKPVYNVVYRWVWDREEARDIVQDTFIRLWRMRYRAQSDTVESLIYRIALNLGPAQLRAEHNPAMFRLGLLDMPSKPLTIPADQHGNVAVQRVPTSDPDVIYYRIDYIGKMDIEQESGIF